MFLGLVFVAASAAGRPLRSYHFVRGEAHVFSARASRSLGAGVAALNLNRRSARGPRFLAYDSLASASARPLDELVASAAAWLLIVLWIWFGLRLVAAG